MRNFLYFVIGVLLAVNASFAFAWETLNAPIDVPIGVSPAGKLQPMYKGAYNIDGITTHASTPDSITIKRTAQIAVPSINAAGGKLSANVSQYAKIAIPALATGVKGLIKGNAASIASTVLASYLIEMGWEWMESSQNYLKTPSNVDPETGVVGWYCGHTGFEFLGCDTISALARKHMAATKPGHTYLGRARNGGQGTVWYDLKQNSPVYQYSTKFWAAPSSSYSPSKVPVKDSDIDALVMSFIEQDKQRAIDLAREKKIPLPIAPVAPGATALEAAPQTQESPASQPSTTQSTAADGTVTRTDCTDSVVLSFSPDGTMTNNAIKRCTTTIALPDGTVKPGGTTISGQPVAPPSTSTGTETKPPALSCEQLGNCDWLKELTATSIFDWMRETPTAEGDTSNLNKTDQFDISSQLRLGQDDFFSGGQCPKPIQISVSGAVPLQLELPYEPMCRFVLMVRPMLLALGALASLFIIFGRR